MTTNAQTTHAGDNKEQRFRIGFPYLPILDTNPAHLTVTLDAAPQILGTDFEVAQQSQHHLHFFTAPTKDAVVLIRRVTPHPVDPSALLFDFTNQDELFETNLENALRQCVFYAEEVEDLL